MTDETLLRQLHQETLFARQRVYHAAEPTPLEIVPLPEDGLGPVFLKREDLSPIKAYKWRGAYNRMAILSAAEKTRPVITASAGNHAQGVALAAQKLSAHARIHMPRTTPAVKIEAVRRIGGPSVEVILTGDGYDAAYETALAEAHSSGGTYIHAYDDIHVIAGQATLADEIVLSGLGPFDRVYLQIGGGGMAAGVANWLRLFYPKIEIIGVEGTDQASMQAAIAAGSPIRLDQVDLFCDGTAVRTAGTIPFQICREVIDRFVTVTNEEVSNAIRRLWEHARCLLEPSGAMGFTALLKERASLPSARTVVIGCGANLDFGQLALITENAGVGEGQLRHLAIKIPERPGAMLDLLGTGLGGLSIVDFQYGKTHPDQAVPVFGVAVDPVGYTTLIRKLEETGYTFAEVGHSAAVRFRAISCNPALITNPLFLQLDFYERPSALQNFLTHTVRGRTNFIYFNYRYSGERIGRALIGMEFTSPTERGTFASNLPDSGDGYRTCRILQPDEASRILGH